jgi:hypothetical protein
MLLAPALACCASTASIITNAAMHSTIGTARGTTQGSCRPLASRTPSFSSYVTVVCACPIVAAGLKATLKKMGAPFVMPP